VLLRVRKINSAALYLILGSTCGLIVALQMIRVAHPDVDVSAFMVVGAGWLHGYLPYSALWDHKPPGLYLLAALASAAGDVWGWVRIFSIISVTGTALLIGRLASRASGSRLVLIMGALATAIVLSGPSFAEGGGMSETFALLFMTLSLSLALIDGSRRRDLLSGLAAGLALSFSLQAVIILPVIGALMLGHGLKALTRLGSWGVGILLIIGLLAIPFALGGGLSAAFDALVNYDLLYHASAGSRSVLFWALVFFAYGLPWIFTLLVIALPLGPETADRRLFRATWFWLGLTLLWLIYGGRFYSHYALLFVTPAALLFGLALAKLRRLANRAGAIAMSLTLIFTCGIGLWIQSAPLLTAADSAAPGNASVVYIEAHSGPNDTIYVWGDAPWLYVASNRAPASRYFYLLPLMTPGYSESAVAETLASWSARPPEIIVDASAYPEQQQLAPLLLPHAIDSNEDQRNLTKPLDPLRAFVLEHYRPVGYFGALPIYQLETP
jgi:hypothetical protein